MCFFQAISLGLALGADSFSISLSIGLNKIGWRRIIKLSLLFSLMQVVLLVGGVYSSEILLFIVNCFPKLAGLQIEVVQSVAEKIMTFLGAAILVCLGINMIKGYFFKEEGRVVTYSGRFGLFLLAFSVSVDALTAGFGIGILNDLNIVLVSSVAGFVIWLMAFVGLSMGQQIYRFVGYKEQLAGGVLLMYLAVFFLWKTF